MNKRNSFVNKFVAINRFLQRGDFKKGIQTLHGFPMWSSGCIFYVQYIMNQKYSQLTITQSMEPR